MFDLVEIQRGREPLLPEAQRLVRIQREIAHFAGEHYLPLWLYRSIRDHVMNGAQCFLQRLSLGPSTTIGGITFNSSRVLPPPLSL